MENICVLKLDSAFNPIEIIDWREAFILTWLKKAWAVEFSDKWVHSAKKMFQIPSVIVLFQYIDEKCFKLACTSKNVFLRDENKCQYCKNHFHDKNLTIDHVIPKSKGGLTTWDNVVAACKRCNQKKSNLWLKDAPVTLLKPPKRPSYRSIMKKRLRKTNNVWSMYL